MSAVLLCLCLLQDPQIEVEPLTRFVKRGAWVPLTVRVKAVAPYEGTLVAHTDVAPAFAVPVRAEGPGTRTYILPVYFLSSRPRGSVHLGETVVRLEGLRGVDDLDLVVLADPATGVAERSRTQGPQSLHVLHAERLPDGALLESVDGIVASKFDPAWVSWRAGGGQHLGSEPGFDLRPRAFARAGTPRPRSATEPPLSSARRSGRAMLLLLLFGVAAMAGVILGPMKGLNGVRMLAIAAGGALGFSAFTLLWIPTDVVVAREHAVSVAGARGVVTDVVVSVDRTVTLSLDGFAKPLFDVPCRLEFDSREKTTRVSKLALKANTPVSFVSMLDRDTGGPAVTFEGGAVRNRSGHPAVGQLVEGRKLGARVRIEKGGSGGLGGGGEIPDGLDLFWIDLFCRRGRHALIRLEEGMRYPDTGQFVERQLAPRYVVVQAE